MKKSKMHLDIHSGSTTNDLAYLLLYAMAHVLLMTFIMMILAQYAETVNSLLIMKLLIAGELVICGAILLPLSYTFSKNEQSRTLTGMRIKGHNSDLKSSSKLWTFMYAMALYISCIAFFHFVAILFGAPLVREIDCTCHFAALLSSTAILPAITLLGCSQEDWVRVFILNETNHVLEYIIKVISISSIIGAWLGAFPIPLDWDRPWQAWPISCVIGTMVGFCSGLLGGIGYLQYTRIRYGKKTT